MAKKYKKVFYSEDDQVWVKFVAHDGSEIKHEYPLIQNLVKGYSDGIAVALQASYDLGVSDGELYEGQLSEQLAINEVSYWTDRQKNEPPPLHLSAIPKYLGGLN